MNDTGGGDVPSQQQHADIIGGHQGPKELLDRVQAAVRAFDRTESLHFLHESRASFRESDENIYKCVDSSGNTLMHLAVQPTTECLVYVLREYQGARVINRPNRLGKTPLHIAVRNNYAGCLQVLLEHGADPHASNMVFSTILHTAATCNAVECVEYLLAHGHSRVDEVDRSQRTALQKACAGEGNARVVRRLLEHGASTTHVDYNGATALHHAARAGRDDLVRILLENEHTLVDAEAHSGNTALHDAAARGLSTVFQVLVEHGASPVKKNDDGNTPLHIAALSLPPDNVEWTNFIRLVLRLGGEEALNISNAAGKRPVDLVHRMYQHLFVWTAASEAAGSPRHAGAAGGGVPFPSTSAPLSPPSVVSAPSPVPPLSTDHAVLKKSILEQRRREQEERERVKKEEEEQRKREDEERLLRIENARLRAEEAAEQKHAEEEALLNAKNVSNKKKGK